METEAMKLRPEVVSYAGRQSRRAWVEEEEEEKRKGGHGGAVWEE